MTFSPEFRLLCDLTVSDYVMDSVATGDSQRRHNFFLFYSLLIFEVFFVCDFCFVLFCFEGEIFGVNISIIQ